MRRERKIYLNEDVTSQNGGGRSSKEGYDTN